MLNMLKRGSYFSIEAVSTDGGGDGSDGVGTIDLWTSSTISSAVLNSKKLSDNCKDIYIIFRSQNASLEMSKEASKHIKIAISK